MAQKNLAGVQYDILMVTNVDGTPVASAGVSKTGFSANGTVGITTGVLIAAGAFTTQFTLQNTSATQNIFISFAAGGATANDFKLAPGASYISTTGNANALNAIASAAGATYAVVGA